MVKSIPPEQLPGNDKHITQLYKDRLIEVFTRRIEKADEYLDEVQPSGWEIAPSTPDKFTKKGLLSGIPMTEDFEKESSSGAKARVQFDDWPDKLLKLAKAIEKEYGVEGESFTYDDAAELNGHGYSRNSVKTHISQKLEPEGFVRESDEGGQSKKMIWARSWQQDYSED